MAKKRQTGEYSAKGTTCALLENVGDGFGVLIPVGVGDKANITRLEQLTMLREHVVLAPVDFKAADGEVNEGAHPAILARAARLSNPNKGWRRQHCATSASEIAIGNGH